MDGAGWRWLEVDGAGWRWVHGLVIPKNFMLILKMKNIYSVTLLVFYFVMQKVFSIFMKFYASFETYFLILPADHYDVINRSSG